MSIQGILPVVLLMAGGPCPVMLMLIKLDLQEAMTLTPGHPHGLTKPLIGTDYGMDSLEKISRMPTWKPSLFLMIMKTSNISISIISDPMQTIQQEEDLVCRCVHEACNGLRYLLKMLFSGITKLQI